MSAFQQIPPFTTREGVLSDDEHAEVLEWVLRREAELTPSRVTGDAHRPGGRRALSYYGDPPWRRWLTDRIGALLPGVVPDLGMPTVDSAEFEVELVAYGDQCFISRHRDTGTGKWRHASDRIVSMVYYLYREPKSFTGGELRLWPLAAVSKGEAAYRDVAPIQNGLVAFPSWAIHEVLPVLVPSGRYEDSRFAINVWAQRARASA